MTFDSSAAVVGFDPLLTNHIAAEIIGRAAVHSEFYPATAMPDPDWWDALWPQPGAVIVALGIEPGTDVVDLCCGDGLFTLPLARVARRVVAIDLDPMILDRARARLGAAGVTNCKFVAGNAYSVAELVPGPVDAAFVANTFHGVPDKGRLAHAVADVLRPRGRFIIVNWHRRPREETVVLGQSRGPKTEMRMAPADVSAAVEPAGFKMLSVIELPPYHYGAIFQKADAQQGPGGRPNRLKHRGTRPINKQNRSESAK